jgi:hypothetical protein
MSHKIPVRSTNLKPPLISYHWYEGVLANSPRDWKDRGVRILNTQLSVSAEGCLEVSGRLGGQAGCVLQLKLPNVYNC